MTATATRERPVLFSGPMVRAILDDEHPKTQTRRAIFRDGLDARHHMPWCVLGTHWQDGDLPLSCPYGQPGDRLWVREAYRLRLDQDDRPPSQDERKNGAWYDIDEPRPSPTGCAGGPGKLRSGRFMSRWASRITLEITGVRVERLQQITEEDAVAEGCRSSTVRWWQGFTRAPDGSRGMTEGGASPDGPPPEWMESPELQTMTTTAREAFSLLWNQLNGNKPGCDWASSPWVWVIAFRRVEP